MRPTPLRQLRSRALPVRKLRPLRPPTAHARRRQPPPRMRPPRSPLALRVRRRAAHARSPAPPFFRPPVAIIEPTPVPLLYFSFRTPAAIFYRSKNAGRCYSEKKPGMTQEDKKKPAALALKRNDPVLPLPRDKTLPAGSKKPDKKR